MNQEWVCSNCGQVRGKITMAKGDILCVECNLRKSTLLGSKQNEIIRRHWDAGR